MEHTVTLEKHNTMSRCSQSGNAAIRLEDDQHEQQMIVAVTRLALCTSLKHINNNGQSNNKFQEYL